MCELEFGPCNNQRLSVQMERESSNPACPVYLYERTLVSTLHTKPLIILNLNASEFRLVTQALTGTLKPNYEKEAETLGERLLDQLIHENELRLTALKKARTAFQDTEEIPVTVLRPGSTLGIADFGPFGGPSKTKEWAGRESNPHGVAPGGF